MVCRLGGTSYTCIATKLSNGFHCAPLTGFRDAVYAHLCSMQCFDMCALVSMLNDGLSYCNFGACVLWVYFFPG